MSVLLFRCSNELFISGFLWFIAFTFCSFSSAKTYISFVHTCFPLESWTFLSSLFKYFCLVISTSEQSVPQFLLTFFPELSYIFFFAHLIIFTWMLDVTCGRTVEPDPHCSGDHTEDSRPDAVLSKVWLRAWPLVGAWLLGWSCVSVAFCSLGSSFPSLPSLRRACSVPAEGSMLWWGWWWASSLLSRVSPGVLAAFSVHPVCARAGSVGVKPGSCLMPGSWVWGEPSLCKKQVHYLLRDSYALSSVGTPKSS